jgi:hypothetical protein
MNAIANYYKNAELSMVAYAILAFGMNPDQYDAEDCVILIRKIFTSVLFSHRRVLFERNRVC